MSAGTLASLAANLLLVPLLYRHLGPQGFGVWATLTSVGVMLVVLDPSNALVQRVAPALADGDVATSQRVVAATFVAMSAILVTLLALFAVLSTFVDWAQVWNVPTELADATRSATWTLMIATALGLLCGVVDRLNLARQRAGLNGLIALVAATATLLVGVLVVSAGGSLPAVVAATTLPAVAVRGVALAWVLHISPALRPSRGARGELGRLLSSFAAFGALQVGATLSYNSDQIVVARILGSAAVAQYAVPAKAFGLLVALTTAATAPLWPALLEARAKGETSWIRRQSRDTLLLVGGFAAAYGVALFLLGPWALVRWVGSDYEVHQSLLLAFACWGFVYATTSVLSFVLLALGGLRDLLAISFATVICNVALSIVLTREVGVSGAVWGSVLTYLVITVGWLLLAIRQRLPVPEGAR